ncbi:hypothetical protein HK098_004636 [Nowakowskiella sp. JEL0407]|nr:hypothetical protein HK098_004636 [Nowakowskiella sp. JEL0407]
MSAPSSKTSVARTTVYNVISQIPISVLFNKPKKSLIDVHEDTSLENVLELLSDADILAVPVFKNPETNPKQKIFTGIVSVYDILVYTVFQNVFKSLEALKENIDQGFETYLKINREENEFFATPVGNLVGLTPESTTPFTLHSSDPISSLLQIFTSGAYHRILIINDEALINSALRPDSELTGPVIESSIVLISQTDLIRFLIECAVATKNGDKTVGEGKLTLSQRDEIGNAVLQLFDTPIREVDEFAINRWARDVLGLKEKDDDPIAKQKRIISVQDSMTAIAALRTLYVNQVTAVAVVDKHGSLVANLSASDLRGMKKATLESLTLNVFEFLETYAKRTSTQIKADQLKTVTEDSTFYDALAMITNSYIHRVWITSDDDKPVGVVTLTDILGFFVPA